MKCKFPPELEDKKLLAYLDGEVDQEAKFHLEQCQYCLEKAKDLARVHNLLTARLYRINCPSSLELGEYQLNMLSDSQKLIVWQHLRECPHCTREVDELQNYLGNLTPVGESGVLEGIKTLVARWVGGNPAGSLSPAPSALRGEAKGPLTFEADGIVIILDIQPISAGRVSVLGQVAADDQDGWTDAVVELRQVDLPPINASLDDLGAFRFEEAHAGSAEITITSSYGIIVRTPNFDIAV